MSAVECRLTLEVCSHCGGIAGASAHGHTDAPDWRWKRVEYVPADQLTGAVSERDTALADRIRLVAEVERLRSENEWLHRQLTGR